MREIHTFDYKGITVNSIGPLPGEKSVYFYYGKGGNDTLFRSVYISAVEALLNGWDILYVPELLLSKAVEKAFHDVSSGSLYSFVPRGLENTRKSTLSTALVTGGGALSIVENDAFFSFEAVLGVRYLASSMAGAVVLCFHNGRIVPSFVDSALMEGKSMCVLKTGLTSPALRSLVRDGCPSIDSFSSFLEFPSVVAYPSEEGRYGTDNRRFSIMRI